MAMTDYPRFAWIARVGEDSRISHAQARVLMYIANQNVKGANTTFQVRQETVAENLRVHVNTVANAIKCAQDLGWLALEAERKRGPGHHGANVYRLGFVELPTRECGSSEEELPTRRSEELATPPLSNDPHGAGELPTRRWIENRVLPAETRVPTGFLTDRVSKEPGFLEEPGYESPSQTAPSSQFTMVVENGGSASSPTPKPVPLVGDVTNGDPDNERTRRLYTRPSQRDKP
jgi:hypothetical protein